MNWNTPLKEVESLRKQVAALTKERDDAIGVKKVAFHHYQETKNQLVASQAREKKLREALELAMQVCDAVPNRLQNHEDAHVAAIGQLVNNGNMPDGSSCFDYYRHISNALALPTDDTALKQRLAEEREKCAAYALAHGCTSMVTAIRNGSMK